MGAGRLICLAKYRRYAIDRLKNPNDELRLAILKLKEDANLVCHCDPLPCHGLVIIRAWEWLQRESTT